jgi:hypothetical protein
MVSQRRAWQTVFMPLMTVCIVESGSHFELIALGGQYNKLFTAQAERYCELS